MIRAYIAAALILLASLAHAAEPIVSANTYEVDVRTSPYIDVNAYHPRTCAQMVGDLGRAPASKPIIISDDGTHLKNCTSTTSCQAATPGSGLDASCAAVFAGAAKAKGQHYEHLANSIEQRIEGCGVQQMGWSSLTTAERTTLKRLYPYATLLTPRGKLSVGKNAQGRGVFKWNGVPVTLIGFSSYGTLVSNQVNTAAWLDALDMHKRTPSGAKKGVNLTRVWVIDQWAALKSGCAALPNPDFRGLTPFVERGADLADRYSPAEMNDAFFDRLRRYVSLAWDRGIVVQLTLFERNALKNAGPGEFGFFAGSPYNAANNDSPALLTTTPGSKYPLGFLSDGCSGNLEVKEWHRQLVTRTVRELAGFGNVIFEVMNEPVPSATPDAAWKGRVGPFQIGVGALIDAAASTSALPAWPCP
jgi:hypothetical protein